MVDVYEIREREQFAMNGNFLIFFSHFIERGEKLFVAETHLF